MIDRLRLGLFTAAIGILCLPALASAGQFVFNIHKPNYYSGTFCRAAGNVVWDPGEDMDVRFIRRFRLFVGGNLVVEKLYPQRPGVPVGGPVSDNGGVVFDSTHFPYGTRIEVKVEVLDHLNVTTTRSESIIGLNTALLGNHSFSSVPGTQGHIKVRSALAGKYSIISKLGDYLTLTGWKAVLGGANFVYITTHGTFDYYEMQNGDGFTDDPESDPNSHKAVLMATVGSTFTSTTYPPYNPSAVPPPQFCIRGYLRHISGRFLLGSLPETQPVRREWDPPGL